MAAPSLHGPTAARRRGRPDAAPGPNEEYGYDAAWSAYVTDLVRCVALPWGHYPAEQAPEETYTELREFFAK
jgi:hypothetical protein